jgi:BRO1-like domain
MLVPRLRVPIYSNIGECLKNWLDASYNDHESSSHHRRPTFTSFDCVNELKELNQCRKSISDGITSSESYENARDLVPVMQKYHAMLLEFENQGFPSENGLPQIRLEWEGAFSGEFSEDFLSGLSLERASILWNLAAVESYLASTQDWFASSKACMQASKHFQTSYSLLDHLQELLNDVWEQNCTDFQSNMVTFWKNVFQAQSQVVGYEMASFATRPRHLMLAKLAQGSVPLWNAAIDACTSLRIPQAERWKKYSQAWAAYMSCRAEWHESLNHREKNQIEHEIGRLKKSLSFGSLCYRLWKNGQADERLTHILPNYLRSLRERFAEYDGKIKIPNEIREIRGELLSKGVDPLIPAMIEPPATIFADAVKSEARKAVDKFNGEMYKFLDSMSKKVETTLNKTKEILHSVNLPRALTIHSNGGQGDNGLSKLMSQVEIIQRRHNPDVLRKEFWELQVLAERANILYEKATKQLDEDVDMDALFRQQNPRFSGSVVREVQSSFRQILSKLMEALRKSRNGDDALRSRLGT